jgi:transposase
MLTARASRFQKLKGRLATRGFQSTSYRKNDEWYCTLRGNNVARNGMTLAELESFVDDWDKQHCTTRKPPHSFSTTEVAELVTRYRAGETLRDIEADTKGSLSAIRNNLVAAGVEMRQGGSLKGVDMSTQQKMRRIRLDSGTVMEVSVDPARDTHATLELSHAGGGRVALVVDAATAGRLAALCEAARVEMARQHRLNWTSVDVCSGDLWAFVKPFVPVQQSGRPREDRRTYAAIIYVLINECKWGDLPPRFRISGATAQKRFREWRDINLWANVYTATYMNHDTGLSDRDEQICQQVTYAAQHRPDLEETWRTSSRKGNST